MKPEHYILGPDGKTPVAVDWLTWAKWLEGSRTQRIVAQHLLDNPQPWLWRDLKRHRDHERFMEQHAQEKGRPREHKTIADLRSRVDKIMVSTVFLGLDHSYSDDGPPILFETLVFNGPLHDDMERCATWDEAVAQHAAMLQRVKEALAAPVEATGTAEGGK